MCPNNSVALVHFIPTERPPFVGEVSVNFCGREVSRGQRSGLRFQHVVCDRDEPQLTMELKL
jgi:hypothetical protein